MTILQAKKEHAAELAYLINLAGEGIPRYLWSKMTEVGQDPMELGRQRATREEGGFSYRNARVYEEAGILQGMIVSYQQPDPCSLDDTDEYPKIVQPLVALEAKSPGSWYINAIATFESYRGNGIAQKLLADAEEQAKQANVSVMSLVVASENIRAKKLYEHIGYKFKESEPVVDYPGSLHGGNWLLMVKSLGGE